MYIIYIYKMGKEIAKFGIIEIEKNTFYHQKSPIF